MRRLAGRQRQTQKRLLLTTVTLCHQSWQLLLNSTSYQSKHIPNGERVVGKRNYKPSPCSKPNAARGLAENREGGAKWWHGCARGVGGGAGC